MSKKNRSFLLLPLVPAFLLVSVSAVVQAQNADRSGQADELV